VDTARKLMDDKEGSAKYDIPKQYSYGKDGNMSFGKKNSK